MTKTYYKIIMIKLVIVTVVLSAYDVQTSGLRFTYIIFLHPHNHPAKHHYYACISNRKLKHREIQQEAQGPLVEIVGDLPEMFPTCQRRMQNFPRMQERLREAYSEKGDLYYPMDSSYLAKCWHTVGGQHVYGISILMNFIASFEHDVKVQCTTRSETQPS